jgi:hypothetical protein
VADAEIIHLPVAPPKKLTCSDCDNAAMSNYGVYCTAFHEYIGNELVAAECEAFDRA